MSQNAAKAPRANDPRDQAFLDYWGRVIDWSDPAAPQWLAHFEQRVAECKKLADQVQTHRALLGARVLDIGCQTGALACVLAERGAEVTGIEPEDWVLEAARKRAEGWNVTLTLQTAMGEALPFEDNTFDIVTFVDVIEHCSDSTQCLREIARVLAPGGIAYVYGPNRFAPEWFVKDPHYGLALASVLSHNLGKRYVEWRRGRKGYDVGVFPVGSQVVRTLTRAGLVIEDSTAQSTLRTWHARAPRVLRHAQTLARAWAELRLSAVPLFTVVAKKPRDV
ncbi:MAG: methyltransferase domain-containing protein [Deltaproteobacteria bacterium]|nr:methyltransferase domain-containing protein [Deltaproteobacteria bacterium]